MNLKCIGIGLSKNGIIFMMRLPCHSPEFVPKNLPQKFCPFKKVVYSQTNYDKVFVFINRIS